jgi:signal transduction histidine kinase
VIVRVPALGEAAVNLCWLCPSAPSLAALARSPAAAWPVVRFDPGAVLLVARRSPSPQSPLLFSPEVMSEPALLERALLFLDGEPSAPPDWRSPALRPVWRAGVVVARLAGHLAERLGSTDPTTAWASGLLAPLGWWAAAAVDAAAVARCLDDPAHAPEPLPTERRHWGLDQSAIARRLARRWGLPAWLSAVVGCLALPFDVARPLGADPGLFQVVQFAVSLAQRQGVGLRLQVGASPDELLAGLGRPASDLRSLEEEAAEIVREPLPELAWAPPADEPLLRDLLALAIDNRRLRDCGPLRDLENDFDEVSRLLAEQRRGECGRLHEQKLSALAEFAAGAGHEINNPLAVISGQAQYLLAHEPDGQRQKSLQTIVQQAQRIHHTLRDLMQFARPSRPRPLPFHLGDLVKETTASLAGLAEQRRVSLTVVDGPDCGGGPVLADRGQAAAAVLCLLRNAVEAAPPGGWARVRLSAAGDRIEAAVEDSGDGLRDLGAAQREHIFDPFFSGRQAGRGRGLGLPTAWRLARANGGDVRWDADAAGLTRFVLTLPRAAAEPLAA